jgi:hypothetical protein
MTSDELPVVVGVADHSGWAILVSAAMVDNAPTVVDRRRVNLIEKGVPNQPYHHETLTMDNAAAEELLRTVRRSIAACTSLALDRLAADLAPRYRVRSLAIRQPTLTHMPATVAEAHHSSALYRADGMLYHSAICTAALQRDWDVVCHRRGEEVPKAAAALDWSTSEVEQFLDRLRATLKAPWTSEHRHAFAAAISQLAGRAGTPGAIRQGSC